MYHFHPSPNFTPNLCTLTSSIFYGQSYTYIDLLWALKEVPFTAQDSQKTAWGDLNFCLQAPY